MLLLVTNKPKHQCRLIAERGDHCIITKCQVSSWPGKSSIDKTCGYGKRKKPAHTFNSCHNICSITHRIYSSIAYRSKCFSTEEIKLLVHFPAGLGDHPGKLRGANSQINSCINKIDDNIEKKNTGNEFPQRHGDELVINAIPAPYGPAYFAKIECPIAINESPAVDIS